MSLPSQFTLTPTWLAVRLSHMGDVILTTGVLDYLGQKYDCRFQAATKKAWAPLFLEHPYIDYIHELSDEDLTSGNLFRTFSQLRKKCTGMGLLDLHGNLRTYLLSAFWSGPVLHYPKFRRERASFLKTKSTQAQKILTQYAVSQRYAMAVEALPPSAQQLRPRIWLTEDEKKIAEKKITHVFEDDTVKPIAIHPFASSVYKTWSQKNWYTFVSLCQKEKIPFIIIGQGTPFLPGHKQDFTNTSSLRETCAILASCQALVTGDSGPMHLASAVSTPVFALFGPTTKEWGFYPTDKNDKIFEVHLDCRPCSLHGATVCPYDSRCLNCIEPSTVIVELKKHMFSSS